MRYQKIHSQIWYDEKFSLLTPDAQILFLYILTSPHSNSIGLYVLPMAYMEGDLGWSHQRVSKAFTELLKTGSIMYNSPIIFIKNHLKYNPIDSLNKNQLKNIVKIIGQLPRNPLILEVKPLIEPFLNGLPNPFETLSNTEEEAEAEAETEEKSSRLCAPALDFISQLKEIYAWVDVDTEIQKMKGFLLTPKGKGRKLTHAFAVRWLNRVDKPIEETAQNTQSKQPEDTPPDWMKEAVKQGWKI
jgi:hypothetical protein